MKIIFSLNHFLPGSLAGTEVYTFNLARSLQAAGAEVAVLIPNFDSEQNDEYNYEGIRVMRYPESSESSREMILGKTAPKALELYKSILEKERPDIVHFQELTAGSGIGIYHVNAAKDLGIKIMLTCHLSTYSCQTGNLVYKDERLCDGIIRTHTCTACAFHARGITGMKSLALQAASKIVYATGVNASNWNSSLGTALGFPFVVDKKKQELLQLAMLCDKIVVLTRWYQKILEANGVAANKIQYCPQGLTGIRLTVPKRKISLPIRLVFIGRISRYKGVHLLLEALQKISPDSITLDLYGPVTEDGYAQDCVIQSKEMWNVNWKGAIASDKVVKTLSEYDVLCLPSTFSEMSPLVIQEAFAAGIPVLASNVYGNAEQVQDGVNGWLFDFKSVASLVEKLKLLIADPALVDVAKEYIPATRSFAIIAAEHLVIYQKILFPSN